MEEASATSLLHSTPCAAAVVGMEPISLAAGMEHIPLVVGTLAEDKDIPRTQVRLEEEGVVEEA